MTYGNSDGNTNEEHIRAELNMDQTLFITELVVETPSQGASKTERESQATHCDSGSNAPVADEEAHIRLHANEKEIENKTEIGDKR